MGILDTSLAQRARRSRVARPLGIAAYRGYDRLLPAPPGPRVIANSMPKSGTHLSTALLDQIEGMRFNGRVVMYTPSHLHDAQQRLARFERRASNLRPSHYMATHMAHHPKIEEVVRAHDLVLVTAIRDPRAIVASGMNYLKMATWMAIREDLQEEFPTDRAVIEAMVRGHGEPGDRFYMPDIGSHFAEYAAWASSEAGLLVRFEDLVGAQGGASAQAQRETVDAIVKHLGLGESSDVEELAERIYSTASITFSSGRIDSWRDDLPADLVDEINQRCGLAMQELGYR